MSIRANKQREKIFIDAESLKRKNIYAGSNILRFETSAWNTGGGYRPGEGRQEDQVIPTSLSHGPDGRGSRRGR